MSHVKGFIVFSYTEKRGCRVTHCYRINSSQVSFQIYHRLQPCFPVLWEEYRKTADRSCELNVSFDKRVSISHSEAQPPQESADLLVFSNYAVSINFF